MVCLLLHNQAVTSSSTRRGTVTPILGRTVLLAPHTASLPGLLCRMERIYSYLTTGTVPVPVPTQC